jgi:hypothetical protein
LVGETEGTKQWTLPGPSTTLAPQDEAVADRWKTGAIERECVRSPLLRVVGKLEAIALASASALAVSFRFPGPPDPC